MATWAGLIQFYFGLIVPVCTGRATPCDEDGTTEYKPARPIACIAYWHLSGSPSYSAIVA